MTRIFNERVYGLEESLIASGYPMRKDTPGEFPEILLETEEEREEAVKRGIKLGTVDTGTGHDNYLCGITVQFDMEYSQYFTPQFQRYHWAEIVSSSSKMHRLTKMDVDTSCNKYVDPSVKKNLKYWVNLWNHFDEIWGDLVKGADRNAMYHYSKLEDESKDVKAIALPFPRNEGEKGLYTKYELFMKVISNCPLGFMLTMRVTTNYQQLKTMYLQRNNHKLKEDWGPMCDFIEGLPMFKELCLKD